MNALLEQTEKIAPDPSTAVPADDMPRLLRELQQANEALRAELAERRRAEAERERRATQNLLLQKSECLGRMAGAIAHQFNNKLQAVMGNLELALADLGRTAGRAVDHVTNAMQATRRAAQVSGQMLTYLGQTPSKREPMDLAKVCRLNLPMVRVVMPKTVALETHFPSPGPSVNADAKQVTQLLANLVTNAWEAGHSTQGSVRVSVTTARLTEISPLHRFPIDAPIQDHGYACLEVADTGSGIADADIGNLFDPFFSSKFTGRGMGLPVVLGIVRAHAGVITVESEPGRGSIFRVYFPLTTATVARSADKVAEAQDMQGRGTVLMVDDEPMIRDAAVSLLTGLGFTVLAARDGVEALDVFRQHRDDIRCVVCDLTMPRMSGWATLTALRQLAPGIPVILTSGYNEAQVMNGNHPERPQVFLNKPFGREQLSDAIRQALAGDKTINN